MKPRILNQNPPPGIKPQPYWPESNTQISVFYDREWTLPANIADTSGNISFATCYIMGSRLTDERNFFNSFMDLNLSNFANNFNIESDMLNAVKNARDVNAVVWEGTPGQTNMYSIKPYKYVYLNGSEEYYYEVAKRGSATTSVSEVYLTFTLGTTWTTVYQEVQTITLGSTVAAIAAAFQLLLLTGLVFLFGPGKFNPYGLMHRMFPSATIAKYQPVEDTEAARLRFFLTEYLDTTPLGVADMDMPTGGLVMPQKKQKTTLPLTTVSVLSIVLGIAAFIMLAAANVGGSKVATSVHFLVVNDGNATNAAEVGLGLWGYCRLMINRKYNCDDMNIPHVFGNFKTDTTMNTLDASVLNQKSNPVAFTLLLTAVVFMGLAIFSRLLAVSLSALRGSVDVVAPTTATVSAMFACISFAVCMVHYTTIKNSAQSFGMHASYGDAMALVGVGVPVACGAAAGLWMEYIVTRRRRRELREWKRGSMQIIREELKTKESMDSLTGSDSGYGGAGGGRRSLVEGGEILGKFGVHRRT
ncbi:hypothetical protein HDV00_003872 [Rhizophlyctis rosea]|nr:hypothetical protein HDV00_003872 [Rhizophlyctis rosea]